MLRSQRYLITRLCGALMIAPLGFIVMKNSHADTQDAFAIFARGLQIDRKYVVQAQRVEFTNAAGMTSLVLGIQQEGDRSSVALVPVMQCGNADCLGKALRLTSGQSAHVLDVVDIAGLAQTIDLAQPRPLQTGRNGPAVKHGHRWPALLVKSSDTSTGAVREMLSLIALRATPKLLWQTTIRSTSAESDNYETVEVRLVKGSGEFLDLALLQQALPKKGEEPFMPGPPLTLVFRMRAGTYARVFD